MITFFKWIYKYNVLGIGSYIKEKLCDHQTAHDYTTLFASNKILIHSLIHSFNMYNNFFSNFLKHWNDLLVLIENERSLFIF